MGGAADKTDIPVYRMIERCYLNPVDKWLHIQVKSSMWWMRGELEKGTIQGCRLPRRRPRGGKEGLPMSPASWDDDDDDDDVVRRR